MAWDRRNPVMDQKILREVLNDNPELLLERKYPDLLEAYNRVAVEQGRATATRAALTQVLRHRFKDWDEKLSQGERL